LRPRSAPDKPAAITNVLRPPSIGSVRQRPAGCIKARRCLRKKLPRPGVIRPGRVHKHGRRRRPGGATTPFHQRGLWPPRPGSGAARSHVSAAAGRTRWSHRGPTECGRKKSGIRHRPGRERAREQPTGASHGPRLHGSRSTDATLGMPNRAARLSASGDRRMTGRRRRIGRESRFRSQIIAEINAAVPGLSISPFSRQSAST
jgi:hypothetical protein